MAVPHGISVALCTHNGERFIAAQVVSILAQSQPPMEIVLSDDASTDGTVAVVREAVQRYCDGHPACATRLRVLENAEALGVTKNFEQAILACNGEFIALSDQDDVWAIDKLERTIAVFEARPDLLLLHTDARLINEAGMVLPGSLFRWLGLNERGLRAIHAGAAFDLLMRRNVVTGATTIIRSGLAEVAAPFPASWVHDEWLAIVAAARAGLDVLAEPLIDYRQHAANQIGVQRLSILQKGHRMLEPGVVRNRRLLARATELVQRFDSMAGLHSDRRYAALCKLQHEEMRSSLKRPRRRRVIPVLREVATGRYKRFGRGLADAVRDITQPR